MFVLRLGCRCVRRQWGVCPPNEFLTRSFSTSFSSSLVRAGVGSGLRALARLGRQQTKGMGIAVQFPLSDGCAAIQQFQRFKSTGAKDETAKEVLEVFTDGCCINNGIVKAS